MSDQTAIEWTDATWNPIRGCTLISPGCANCYAQTFAERFRGVSGHPYEQGFDLRFVPEKLGDPFRWTRPKRVFVNSMSDLFHESVPEAYIERVIDVMLVANWHTYQTLTKRDARMVTLLTGRFARAAARTHLWWGVSVEDRKHGLPRVRSLCESPASRRFLSIEPLLEDLGTILLDGIDWVIVGGESGPRARPMRADWVRSIKNQCDRAGVPFFFKQWGGTRKSRAGRVLDGALHDACPTFPAGSIPPRDVRAQLARSLDMAAPLGTAL